MRRVTLMLAAMAVMVSLFAVAAYAAQIKGTENTEDILETSRADTVHALVGDDTVNANVYQNIDDTDRAHGNEGDDTINVNDADGNDTAWGGSGDDTCTGDLGDTFHGCETIAP